MLKKLMESIENEWDAKQSFTGYGQDIDDKDIDAGAKAIIAKVEKGLGLKKASVRGMSYPTPAGQKEVPVPLQYTVTFQSSTGVNLLKISVYRQDEKTEWSISDIITPCITRILLDMLKSL